MDTNVTHEIPTGLPLATLKTLDIQKLQDQDPVEKQMLLNAAENEGFFYLSFQNLPEVEKLTTVLNGIYDLERDLFDMSEEEKLGFDVDTLGAMKLNG